MQKVIEELAAKHGVDFGKAGAYLRLEMDCYLPLVIERLGGQQVSVTHYFIQNGDACADPDILFFTGYGEWVPVEITQLLSYRHVSVVGQNALTGEYKIAEFDREGQEEVGEFVHSQAGE